MHAVKRASLFILLFLCGLSCKPRLDSSSVFDDTPVGLEIEHDPTDYDVARIVEIGTSNNYSFLEPDLNAALTGGSATSVKSILKTSLVYMNVNNQRTMVGYVLYQVVDNRYVILTDLAIDQTLPDADIRALTGVMKKEVMAINEKQGLPILHTIFSAHSRKTELLKAIGFQAIKEIGNQTVTSGVTETGDINYQDEYYRFGDAKKEVIEAFADTYQATALLNKNKIVTDDPELRDRISRSFVDLRDYYRKFPGKHTEKVTRLDIEENILRSLLKIEVGSYILLGDKGGGKSFNLDRIVAKLARGGYPQLLNTLKNFEILRVDASQIMANTTYRGQLENKIKALKDRSEYRPIIIYADEVHRLAGLGKSSEGGGSDLFESLKEGLADGSIRLIGSTTPQEYYDTFAGRDAVVDRLFIDNFGIMSEADVKDIIRFHFEKKRGLAVSQDVIDKVYLFCERFEPNGGQVRAKVKFIDDFVADRQLHNKTTPPTGADVIAAARRYFAVGNLVFPEDRQDFLRKMAAKTGAAALDATLMESVYAGLADGASKQISLIEGPEGSGRSYASEAIAKSLGRPQVEISLLAYQTPEKFPELMARVVAELDKKGTSHMVFAFSHVDTVFPDVQRQLVEMFQKGVIITKVRDANTNTYSTRKIKVPNVLAHFIANASNIKGAAVVANAAPYKIKLASRNKDTYAAIVRTHVKKLLATSAFSDLKMSEEEISTFITQYVEKNYPKEGEEGRPFDADIAKIENQLRMVADGKAMGDKAPDFIKALCDGLAGARPK